MRMRITQFVTHELDRLDGVRSRPALARPETLLDHRADDLGRLTQRADELIERVIERDLTRLNHLTTSLRALSPQSTLDRGYAVVQRGSDVIRDAEDVRAGDQLLVTVAKGSIDAVVGRDR